MSYELMQACVDNHIEEVSASEWRVLLALCRFADKDGRCFPTTESIAFASRLNPRTVIKALAGLKEKEVISWKFPSGKRRMFFINTRILLSTTPVKTSSAKTDTPVKSCTDPCKNLQGTPVRSDSCYILEEEVKEEVKEEVNRAREEAHPSVPAKAAGGQPRSDGKAFLSFSKSKPTPTLAKPVVKSTAVGKVFPQPRQPDGTMTEVELAVWGRWVMLAQQGYPREKWSRWAVEKFPGGLLADKARRMLADCEAHSSTL